MPTMPYLSSREPDLYHIAAAMEAQARHLRGEAEQLERDAAAIRECAPAWHEKHPAPKSHCPIRQCPPFTLCRHG